MKNITLEFYPLRRNLSGFREWCRIYYYKSKFEVKTFEDVAKESLLYVINHKKEYEEALMIQNQYQSLLLVLNPFEVELLNEVLINGKQARDYADKQVDQYCRRIYEKWCIICFTPENSSKRKQIIDGEYVGSILKEIRESLGLSVQLVSQRIGVNHNTLRNYERGSQVPSILTIRDLSRIYKVDIYARINSIIK